MFVTTFAHFLINCFAVSDHIAGTVMTHRTSSSVKLASPFISPKNLIFNAKIDLENTVSARRDLPFTSGKTIPSDGIYKK